MPRAQRQHLLTNLHALPQAPRYWVAYSGGLDSTVLLHLLATAGHKPDVVALHVDHGLSVHSGEWSEHCRCFCEELKLPLRIEKVEITAKSPMGLEAAARRARYDVFEQVLKEGEVMLTAHHRDDQAETLLLQLLRGGGVRGLAAMPQQRPLGRGRLARPLLDVPRETLKAYALEHRLEWIDDPSNFDTSLERNFLRHDLLPQLERRRAGIREVLARSAGHFAESSKLLDELAEMDLQQAGREDGGLSVTTLKALSPERCRNLLRYSLRRQGLPLPDHKHLWRILDELLPAAEDAMPLVSWPGAEVRRYRDALYCMKPLHRLPAVPVALPWKGQELLPLPDGLGQLHSRRRIGEGVSAAKLAAMGCEVRLRQGGESIKPQGRHEHHTLKKLYQEAGVPPWERDRRPLVFLNGELAQVPGYWTAAEFATTDTEEGFIFDWRPEAIEKDEQNDDNY